jgi:hypothetical protein
VSNGKGREGAATRYCVFPGLEEANESGSLIQSSEYYHVSGARRHPLLYAIERRRLVNVGDAAGALCSFHPDRREESGVRALSLLANDKQQSNASSKERKGRAAARSSLKRYDKINHVSSRL